MNINTNYLIRGLSAVYSQLEVSKKNTLVLLKNLLTAKNTGEKQTKISKNNKLNNNNIIKRNAPIMMVENHLSGISSRDRLANNTLKMTRYHPPLSEPHNDLAQLLAQPLRDFQSSPTEAYNKWIVSPATPRPGSKISPPRLQPAPPPPTQVQKRPTASNGTLVIRNTVNAEQQVANTPALQQKQSHAPLIRAQSQPITTHQQQQASLMSELSAVLAKRNAVNIEQQVANTPALQQKQSHAPLIRAQSQPITTNQQQQTSLMGELSAVLAKRNAVNIEQQVANTPALQQKQSHAPLIRAQSQPITTHQQASLMSELSAVLAKRNSANTNGNQSKHLSPLTPPQTKDTPVYVKEFSEIF